MPAHRIIRSAAAAVIAPASVAGAATFTTDVDGLEVLYGGFVGDFSETTSFDFGHGFHAIWSPTLRLAGTTDLAGSTLTFQVTIEGDASEIVSIIATSNAFNVVVPLPPAVGLLDGAGTITLALDTAHGSGADLATAVTSATLATEGIPVVTKPFAGCGTLVPTDECVLFQADAGGLFVIDDLGGFGIGDPVSVEGTVDPNCITICLAANAGCIEVASITSCDCSGDTNDDGVVDVTDLVNVIIDHGGDGSEHGGDVNGDGTVDVLDIVEVILHWGAC